MASSTQPVVHTIFEPKTCTWQYIVADPTTKDAAIIDSVLDYDTATSTISTSSADNLLETANQHGYKVVYILETHVHADHLTAAKYIQQALVRTGAPKPQVCIGRRIKQLQHTFASTYHIPEAEYTSAFDKLLEDGKCLSLGQLEIKVIHLPGHTPDHLGYVIGSCVFAGDSIFLPDVGSARCDFPDGDAGALYKSMTQLLDLPPDYKIYSGHDYPPTQDGGRDPCAFATVAEQREKNKHAHKGVSLDEFVQWRSQRDATLGEPKLLHQALQFNIRAGQLPAKSEKGHRFLHVPFKVAEKAWM